MTDSKRKSAQNLILLSGFGGSGKSACAQALWNQLDHVTIIEADHLFRIKPFVMDTEKGRKQIGRIKLANSLSVITTFIEEGFENIIVDGLVWSQEELNAVAELSSNHSCRLFLFWLDANKKVRFKRALSRSRDEADSENFLEKVESSIVDPRPFHSEYCCYVEVDVDNKNEAEVVEVIISHLRAE